MIGVKFQENDRGIGCASSGEHGTGCLDNWRLRNRRSSPAAWWKSRLRFARWTGQALEAAYVLTVKRAGVAEPYDDTTSKRCLGTAASGINKADQTFARSAGATESSGNTGRASMAPATLSSFGSVKMFAVSSGFECRMACCCREERAVGLPAVRHRDPQRAQFPSSVESAHCRNELRFGKFATARTSQTMIEHVRAVELR